MKITRIRWRYVWLCIGLALAYFVAGRLCLALSSLFGNVPYVLYIPAGLSLTASLLWGRRMWPGVFLGELAVTLSWGQPLGSCLLMASGNGLEAALAGWWLHDRLGRRLEFDRLDHVMRLLVAELLVLQPLDATFGAAALTLSGTISPKFVWSVFPAWYASNLLAQLIIAPVILAWLRWRRPAEDRKGYWELAGLLLLTFAVGLVGSLWSDAHQWALPATLFLFMPLLVWASVRFVPTVPLTVGAIMSLTAFASLLFRGGQFSGAEMAAGVFRINVFMTVCLGTSLFLAAAMGQQRRFEREQAELIDDLSSALNKVKQLQEIVTFCAWTGRVRWQERWVSVETFLRERYQVYISHGISEEAVEAMLKDMPSAKRGRTDPTAGGTE